MNIERHNQIIAKIEENPSCWNQAHWHCGTAHCYGGWAQILSGKKADIATSRRDARQWLDLSFWEAGISFSVFNTLEDLKNLPEMFSYNHDGYTHDGYTHDGYDRDGYNRDGLDANLNTKEPS